MKNLLPTLLLLIPFVVLGQGKPRTRIYHDTVKSISGRVEYLPDTIPVYFKELIITKNVITWQGGRKLDTTDIVSERWRNGFVVWQTYKKSSDMQFSNIMSFSSSSIQPVYYIDEYQPSKGLPGQFLYADKKPCTNIVLNSFKR